MKDEAKKLNTACGRLYADNENSMTVGPEVLFCYKM